MHHRSALQCRTQVGFKHHTLMLLCHTVWMEDVTQGPTSHLVSLPRENVCVSDGQVREKEVRNLSSMKKDGTADSSVGRGSLL